MSGPLLFFMIVFIGDIVLKSLRDKKKIERSKQEKGIKMEENTDYNRNQQKEVKNEPNTIRGIMEILREEAEKKQRKEMDNRQGRIKQLKEPEFSSKKQERIKKEYEDNKYWEEKKKKEAYVNAEEAEIKLESNKEEDIRKELIRGIIFSEIISEPKAIKNQKRSM